MVALVSMLIRKHRDDGSGSRKEWPPDEEMIREAERLVKVRVTPPFNYSFARMKPGVLQHIDRRYAYDVVPEELVGGFLFQGIHRPPKGTVIEFELSAPARVYWFFHAGGDGGYGPIFERLEGWERCEEFPQYDIHNGDHGLQMVMYRLNAGPGTCRIPATTADRACFNIVFQADPVFSAKSVR
jgi:hypothetical protein